MDKYGCIWEDERIRHNYTRVHLPEHDLTIKDIKCNFFDQAQDYKAGAPMIVTARQLALSEDYSEADLDTQAYQMLAGPSLTDITTNFAAYSPFTLENDTQEMFFSTQTSTQKIIGVRTV